MKSGNDTPAYGNANGPRRPRTGKSKSQENQGSRDNLNASLAQNQAHSLHPGTSASRSYAAERAQEWLRRFEADERATNAAFRASMERRAGYATLIKDPEWEGLQQAFENVSWGGSDAWADSVARQALLDKAYTMLGHYGLLDPSLPTCKPAAGEDKSLKQLSVQASASTAVEPDAMYRITMAVAMKAHEPELSVRKAAEKAGISYSKLQRSPLWRQVCENVRHFNRRPHSGFRDSNGNVEAIAN